MQELPNLGGMWEAVIKRNNTTYVGTEIIKHLDGTIQS